jgi:hypothetical protein
MPARLTESIRAAVAAEVGVMGVAPRFRLVETERDWISVWLMPFAVGGVASILLAVSMLWFILNSVSSNFQAVRLDAAPRNDDSPAFVVGTIPTPGEYASSRMDVAYESPSINPRGSLVELTRLLVADDIRDDEVVVVADVFENGSAQIAEVVEPPRDKRAVRELERAFQSDLAFSPFVPAGMDQRSDRVRVVFRIQSVSVYSH